MRVMVGSVPLWSVVVTGRVNQTEYYVDYVSDTLSVAYYLFVYFKSNETECSLNQTALVAIIGYSLFTPHFTVVSI